MGQQPRLEDRYRTLHAVADIHNTVPNIQQLPTLTSPITFPTPLQEKQRNTIPPTATQSPEHDTRIQRIRTLNPSTLPHNLTYAAHTHTKHLHCVPHLLSLPQSPTTIPPPTPHNSDPEPQISVFSLFLSPFPLLFPISPCFRLFPFIHPSMHPSSPIQSNPLQSNPIHSNPIHPLIH